MRFLASEGLLYAETNLIVNYLEGVICNISIKIAISYASITPQIAHQTDHASMWDAAAVSELLLRSELISQNVFI